MDVLRVSATSPTAGAASGLRVRGAGMTIYELQQRVIWRPDHR